MSSPEEVADHKFTSTELAFIEQRQRPLVIGDPISVREQLEELVDRYQVDELMITTMVYNHDDRLRSYELVADAWQINQD